MTEDFTLTVNYKNEEYDFTARLLLHGYSHKFEVEINDTSMFFEPDDSGSYRAITMQGQDDPQLLKIDKVLLKAISQKLEEILA